MKQHRYTFSVLGLAVLIPLGCTSDQAVPSKSDGNGALAVPSETGSPPKKGSPPKTDGALASSYENAEVVGDYVVSVVVTNVATKSGYVTAALYDREETYNGGGSVRGKRVEVDSDAIRFQFEHLPPGKYAIRIFHDQNSNGDMDTNAFGIPEEPFAFSNNAKGRFGPASWSDASFEVRGDQTQTISF